MKENKDLDETDKMELDEYDIKEEPSVERVPRSISDFLPDGLPVTLDIEEWPVEHDGKFGRTFMTIGIDFDGIKYALNYGGARARRLFERIQGAHGALPCKVVLVRKGEGFQTSYYGRVVRRRPAQSK